MRKLHSLLWFKEHLWEEMNRFNSEGDFVQGLTCTEENYENLHGSQFVHSTKYGEVFQYKLNGE